MRNDKTWWAIIVAALVLLPAMLTAEWRVALILFLVLVVGGAIYMIFGKD